MMSWLSFISRFSIFSLLRQQVALQGGIEFLQLVVVTDYLQLVAREDDHVAIRDVQAVRTAVECCSCRHRNAGADAAPSAICHVQLLSSGTSNSLMWISRSSSLPS